MQQKKPAALILAEAMERNCLGVRAGRLQRLIGREYDQALRPLGLSISQMEVLSALTLTGIALRPSDLARALSIERSTMSRSLSLMEQRGLIRTTEASPTGRSTQVDITTLGRRTLSSANNAWNQAQLSVTSAIGSDAAAILDTWITKLEEA